MKKIIGAILIGLFAGLIYTNVNTKLMDNLAYLGIDDTWEDAPSVSQEEGTAVLKKLGIELSNQEDYGMDWSYDLALEMEGMGDYDDEKMKWIPTSTQIYALDAEVYDIDNMYIDYFKGLQMISSEDLTFTDVWQDDSQVNWNDPSGIMTVHFTINGQAFEDDLTFYGDWLNSNIQGEVNDCLEELDIEKRFYGIYGISGPIYFYCTPEWAKEFEKATYCSLELNL